MSEEKRIEPLVSVIMSTYREVGMAAPDGERGSMLSRAIESVLAQSWTAWELWVVSDHPPPEDLAAIEEAIASFGDERIHYEDLPGRSGLAAPGVRPKKLGLERSSGKLLAFLDADNAFEPDHLRRSVHALHASREVADLAYSDSLVVFTGKSDDVEEDLLSKAVSLPYNLMGAICGEKFAGDLKRKVFPPMPLGPLGGAPYTWEKPDWDSGGAEKLAHYNFIDMSDAVMTREAYEAAGGFRNCLHLDWQLWLDMLRVGRNRFRHIPHPGVRYSTSTLKQHRQYYALGLAGKLNLPLDLSKPDAKNERATEDRFRRKHDGAFSRVARPDRPMRVLLMGEAAALSHVARPSLLAAHLHREGYDVCFARDPRYSDLIPENGVPVVALDSLPASVVLDRLYRNEPIFDVDTIERYVADDLRILRKFKPDVVVGDQRISLAVSSRLAGVPYVNIADGHWSPSAGIEFELTESPVSRLLGMPLSSLIFQFVHPVAFALHTMPLNMVRMKNGLPGIGPDIKSHFTYGDYTVHPNDAELFPLKKPLPRGHLFIGPLLWSPSVEKPVWWDQLPEDRPFVYVSLGSTGQPDLLRTVFSVLGKLPVTVLAATAARSKPRDVPANVFVADFLPGREAALRSKLVICNGGAMSGPQALAAGVPFLGLVSNMDQMLFSKAVRGVGACELIREGEVDEHSLRQMVQAMLTQEKYHAAARKCAARTANSDSCKAFERFISTIPRANGTRLAIHTSAAAG